MDCVYNICQTCLSDGRQLYPLEVIRDFLPELERYFEEIKESIGGVCWECRSRILKFFKFKSNIRKAQNTMWDLKVNKQNGNLSSVSTLSVTHKQTYDYIYTFNEEMEIKTEPTFIKQETDISDCEMDDIKTDIDIDETINFEFVNTEVKDTIQSDDGNVIVSKQETLDDNEISNLDGENDEQTKFSKVIFTEEEMQECREMKRSHLKFRLKCCDCVTGFKWKYKYDLHMEKKHDLKAGSILCDICKMRFKSEFKMSVHRHMHYKGYKCKLCHYKSTMRNVMQAHCSSHHKVDTVNKIHSNVIVETVEKLTEHVEKMHKFSCNLCPVTFAEKRALWEHASEIHGWKMEFICDICARTFVNKVRLECHMATHDDKILKQLSYCAECDIQYKTIRTYRNHLRMSVTHSNKLFQCSHCAKKFASKAYYQRHRKTCHPAKNRRCKLCNEVLSQGDLMEHNIVRHGHARTRNHHCDECGKSYVNKSLLNEHMNSHTGKRPHVCATCGAAYSHISSLSTHKKNNKRCWAIRERQTATAATNSADGSNVGHTVN